MKWIDGQVITDTEQSFLVGMMDSDCSYTVNCEFCGTEGMYLAERLCDEEEAAASKFFYEEGWRASVAEPGDPETAVCAHCAPALMPVTRRELDEQLP